MSPGPRPSFADTVLRIYGRYVVEVVEDLGFCPWAAKAREGGQVDVRVQPGHGWDLDWAIATTEEIGGHAELAIGILIFPRLEEDVRAFGRRCNELRHAHEKNHKDDGVPMAMAPFHPHVPSDVTMPGRLTSFVRRSPDPTIQLVRRSVLDDIRRNDQRGTDYIDPTKANLSELLKTEPTPAVHERILEANRETIQRVGIMEIERRFDSISEDRLKSYALY